MDLAKQKLLRQLKEMGLRSYEPSFDVRSIKKIVNYINDEMNLNFNKKSLVDNVILPKEPGEINYCSIVLLKPLVDINGKSFADIAQNYLRGAKINLSKIAADSEILSTIATIAKCIEYDDAKIGNDKRTITLVKPEVLEYNSVLFAPSSNAKVKVVQEEEFYGVFSDTGYGPNAGQAINSEKSNLLKDCLEVVNGKKELKSLYRPSCGQWRIYKTREEVGDAVRQERDREAYDSQYSRGYYRTSYKAAKCNAKGELIITTRDFYNPDLWGSIFPTEDEIKECIKVYNAKIMSNDEEND